MSDPQRPGDPWQPEAPDEHDPAVSAVTDDDASQPWDIIPERAAQEAQDVAPDVVTPAEAPVTQGSSWQVADEPVERDWAADPRGDEPVEAGPVSAWADRRPGDQRLVAARRSEQLVIANSRGDREHVGRPGAGNRGRRWRPPPTTGRRQRRMPIPSPRQRPTRRPPTRRRGTRHPPTKRPPMRRPPPMRHPSTRRPADAAPAYEASAYEAQDVDRRRSSPSRSSR